MRRILASGLLVLVLTACGSSQATSTPASTATTVAQASAPTAAASATPIATATALPTATAGPTRTPRPTRTPAPTPSPLPTQTVPPEITAEPAELDTPNLSEENAPPTPKPEPKPNPESNPDVPVRVMLPSVGIDAEPISVGLDEQRVPIVPKHDVGWYNLSARPGEGENVVFWGHVLRWKDSPDIPAPFANLKNAQIGDKVVVYTADGTEHAYAVTQQVWATPDQVQYILPVGSERVTLVSCIGDKVIGEQGVELTHRLITIAEPLN